MAIRGQRIFLTHEHYLIYSLSMNPIGKAIKEIIKKKGTSRYRISKDLGIDEASLHRSLMDSGNPEWKTIEILLDYLGYDFRLVKRKEVTPEKAMPSRSQRKIRREVI